MDASLTKLAEMSDAEAMKIAWQLAEVGGIEDHLRKIRKMLKTIQKSQAWARRENKKQQTSRPCERQGI